MVETWIIDGVRYTTEPTKFSYDELEEQNAALLEALKAILDIDNPPAGESGHVDFNDAIEMGRQAIAKAEGGE